MDVRSITAHSGVVITPHDTNAQNVKILYVGTGGNAVVQFADSSSTVTLKGLVAGSVYRFDLILIKSTGTTAADLVQLG